MNTRLSVSIDMADGSRATYEGAEPAAALAALPAGEIRAISVSLYTENQFGEHHALSGNLTADRDGEDAICRLVENCREWLGENL